MIAGAAKRYLLAGGRFGSLGPDDASQFNRLSARRRAAVAMARLWCRPLRLALGLDL
ncbi:MAG: hypothetical protein KIS63_12655 [Caldilineales bacterium]|nr:hypothetical protein [Caldilineales bacterium]